MTSSSLSEFLLNKALDNVRKEFEEQQRLWADIDEQRYMTMVDREVKVITFDKWLEQKIPLPPHIVEPFFPYGGLCLFHGVRGIGKSCLATSMMHSVATGEDFLGRFPVKQGRVCYIQIDMPEPVFQDRLWKSRDFWKLENCLQVTGPVQIMKARHSTPWVQEVESFDPDLMVIDTLRKAHQLNENDSDSAGRFYSKLRELFGWRSTLLIHHERKSSSDNFGFQGEAFRGSSAWLDDVDTGIRMYERGGNKQKYLAFTKLRVTGPIDPIPVEINIDNMTISPVDLYGSVPKVARARSKKGGTMASQIRAELANIHDELGEALDADSFRAVATERLKDMDFPADRISKSITNYLRKHESYSLVQ